MQASQYLKRVACNNLADFLVTVAEVIDAAANMLLLTGVTLDATAQTRAPLGHT